MLNSLLAVHCGLLAKWLRVRVRVRAWAREYTVFFFSLWSYKCGEHLRLPGVSVSARDG